MKTALTSCILVSVLALGACASAPPIPERQPTPAFPEVFARRPALPTTADVFALTPAQQADFFAYFDDPVRAWLPRYQRVYDYLFASTLNFTYEAETYTAAEALRLQKGDCLSLAILTTALAHLAGIEIGYQLVDTSPLFELTASTVNKVVHVRSRIFEKVEAAPDDPPFGMVQRKFLLVDYFPERRGRYVSNVSDEAFVAMYYQNMAARALEQLDNEASYWLAREALTHDPRSPAALNLLALAYSRSGMPVLAEDIFRFGIRHADDKLTLLKNYRVLLLAQDRKDEAAAIAARLETMDDPSPYHWYALARASYLNDEYGEALRYYDKALALAPYFHEAYLGKAQSYYRLGSVDRAQEAMKLAIANVNRTATRQSYKAKLSALAAE